MAACALAALATGGAQAGEEARERSWGFGWDEGLTVRHRAGPWQFGLGAGPEDRLSDRYLQNFDPDLPDSLVGGVVEQSGARIESGFVRLSVARRAAAHRTLELAGLLGLAYSWGNESWDNRSYLAWEADWRESRRQTAWDQWTVQLGARLGWQPVPFLALETEFGLSYRWYEYETESWDRWAGDPLWVRTVDTGRNQYFTDFGTYDLTSNVKIIVWF